MLLEILETLSLFFSLDYVRAMNDWIVLGHRGAAGLEPENTLRGVRKALELGVGGVEIDVHKVEEKLLVFHDDTLERTTDGVGSLYSKTPAE